MTKSGCCWHQFSDFIIKNNVPIPIKIVEEQYVFNYLENKIEEWNNGKHIVKNENIFLPDDSKDQIILKFPVDNGKILYLINSDEGILYYFFTCNNLIELMYSDQFFYSKKEDTLSFTNKNSTYKIFNNRIEIDHKNKIKTLTLKDKERKGNVSDVFQIFKEKKLENLEITD
jgi:hypothetical protein